MTGQPDFILFYLLSKIYKTQRNSKQKGKPQKKEGNRAPTLSEKAKQTYYSTQREQKLD